MKCFKRLIISAICTYFILGTIVIATNEEVDTRETNILLDNNKRVEIIDSRVETIQTAVASKISKYDLRDKLSIEIYNQGNSNTCWAFSLRTAFETTLKNTSGESSKISTQHMAYATSDSFIDGKYKYGLERNALDLGTHLIGLGYLTNGSGPIDEAQMKFSDTPKNISLSEIENKTPLKKIEGWRSLGGIHKTNNAGRISYTYLGNSVTQTEVNNIRNEIKQHIINYGAVSTAIRYTQQDLDNENTSLYYNGQEPVTHMVTIIGWDDNYPKENFESTNRPVNNGAYLVQNSYGNKNTYIYISYDDTYIEEYCYGISKINNINYYKIYQHDGQGANYGSAIDLEEIYAASVFSRETNVSEFLNEVSITTLYDANYEIYINTLNGDLTGENVKKVKASSEPLKPGYHTIKLDEPLELKGSKFAIIVKYTKVKNKLFGITLLSQKSLNGESLGEQYNSLQKNQGECYIGLTLDQMQDLYNYDGATKTCIKAFTKKIEDKFDLSDKIKINTKNQGTSNNCWTMPISTVLETNRALNDNDSSQMSAKHMDYATSQSFTDVDLNEYGYNRLANTAGTAEWGLSYFTNGSGPILEMSMPFTNSFDKISFSEITNKTVMAKVEDWVMFPRIFKEITDNGVKYLNEKGEEYTEQEITNIRTQIKLHIMNNGAIATETYIEGVDKYYNATTDSYYCNDEKIGRDHGLAIIGWDDNYSKNNFNAEYRPEHDGAYIVQNSYGRDNEIAEKYYVSYDDPNIERSAYGIQNVVEKDVAKEKIYQYDELGRNASFSVNKGEVYGANVFSRDSRKEEYLKEISISTYADMNYEIYINSVDGSISTEKMQLVAKSYTPIQNGYHTIKLDEKIRLTGDKFAVAVKYIGRNEQTMVTIQSKLTYKEGESPYQNITSNAGESYVGLSLDNMTDMKDMPNLPEGNLCIKALTEDPNGTYSPLKGDVNLDGRISSTDLSLLKQHLVGMKILKGYAFEAADMKSDAKLSATDLATLSRKLVNLD